jgi:hypothetical protein
MALVDRPLSIRDSLAALLAVFRLMDAQLGIDRDATTVRITIAGSKGEERAATRLSDLIRRADAALGVADMAKRNADVPDQCSPLPWRVDGPDAEMVFDAADRLVIDCGARPCVPRELAQANAALIQRSAPAHPQLINTIRAAGHALRSYQHGNESPDLAREIADACEAVLTQMEGR